MNDRDALILQTYTEFRHTHIQTTPPKSASLGLTEVIRKANSCQEKKHTQCKAEVYVLTNTANFL